MSGLPNIHRVNTQPLVTGFDHLNASGPAATGLFNLDDSPRGASYGQPAPQNLTAAQAREKGRVARAIAAASVPFRAVGRGLEAAYESRPGTVLRGPVTLGKFTIGGAWKQYNKLCEKFPRISMAVHAVAIYALAYWLSPTVSVYANSAAESTAYLSALQMISQANAHMFALSMAGAYIAFKAINAIGQNAELKADTSLDNVKAQVKAKKSQLQELTANLAEKRLQAASYEAKARQAKELDQAIKAKQLELEGKSRILEESEQYVSESASARDELEELRAQIEAMQRAISEKGNALSRLDEQFSRKQRELARLEGEIQEAISTAAGVKRRAASPERVIVPNPLTSLAAVDA